MDRPELRKRADEYTKRHGLSVREQLGFGVHGIVLAVERQSESRQSAIKVHERVSDYLREKNVYQRLRELAIHAIHGCQVPQLIALDDDLLVIEMTIVTRPFVLDFGGAYLGRPPDFSEEVLAEWRAEKHEQFGSRWKEVQAILAFLEAHGIFVIDVNPGNISFGD
jgi:hypothetical protein